MYRLSGVDDDILQKVVTNEMAAGFLKTFGVRKAAWELEIGDRERGIIRYLLNTYSGNEALHDLGEDRLEEIGRKIERMYDELIDPHNEYTYDGFGEYLLFLFIEHAGENAFDVRESGYFDIDESTQENYSDVPMFASSSMCIMDELYLRELFAGIYDDIAEDAESDDEEAEEEFVNELIRQASMFSCMDTDDPAGESFIFSDDEFLIYDEPGGTEVLSEEAGGTPGFVMKEEGREPVSGSLKYKIGENRD